MGCGGTTKHGRRVGQYRDGLYYPPEAVLQMVHTQLGKKIEDWSASSKAEFKNDLNKLTKVPLETLRPLARQVARTYPCCNVFELAALEAEQRGLPDPQELSDVLSAWTFVWENIDGESPQAIAGDLVALGLASDPVARILHELIVEAEPFRETAKVVASYLKIGSPLFVGLRGTVDIRCRFHKKDEDFTNTRRPTELVGVQQLIMANLTIHNLDDEESVISFVMDENDLAYMKRFVINMEKELELSRSLAESTELKKNG